MDNNTAEKKTMLSGIQPSGDLHLGNYLGAVKNWAELADEFNCYYFMADLHSLTVRQNPAELRRRSVTQLAQYIACGLDPEKNTLFIQSHVHQHAELGWVLDCYSMFGELSRMTQFKDKSASHADNVNAGLFTYPVLMAGDILLYQADLVPVGADQKQHVELARDVAMRFNSVYGETFRIPEPYIPKVGARIMSLQEPDKKMSKSDPNPNGYILLLDDPDTIRRKLRRAVTDCESTITFDPEKQPGVSNLLSVYCACNGASMEDALAHFEGSNYGVLKNDTAEAAVALLTPVQQEYKRILGDKAYLNDILKNGADRAQAIAGRTLRKVYHKVGFDSIKA